MEEKRTQFGEGKTEEQFKQVSKAGWKSFRSDKRQFIAEMVSKDLDVRDQSMGIKQPTKQFVAVPLGTRDTNGKHVAFTQKAGTAAEYVGRSCWGAQQHTSGSRYVV